MNIQDIKLEVEFLMSFFIKFMLNYEGKSLEKVKEI